MGAKEKKKPPAKMRTVELRQKEDTRENWLHTHCAATICLNCKIPKKKGTGVNNARELQEGWKAEDKKKDEWAGRQMRRTRKQ